ncbi:hypothetical protein C2I19_15385 [Chromobacterium alticapitis]|uniref:DUF342 domain-containing protein n=2 Tax=Chromobacterium alticapitis TaxID=2073169 RepID=A0A2S5DDA4_9NEIS|nr:hypothetical protein C2I19_15385 [Chromobacterium alticapitis]
MRRAQQGLATLFMALTLLAIASLVLLSASRQLVLAHANAQNQHRYHQALNYAEEGLLEGQNALASGKAIAKGKTLLSTAHYIVEQETLPPDRVLLRSTGNYDGHAVTVQRVFLLGSGEDEARSALNLVGDLNLSGSVKLIGDKPVDMTVDGKVTLGGSVENIDTLQSTGDIIVSGNQAINILHSNGNIELSNGRYQTVKTVGNLTLTGSAMVEQLARVNGDARFLNSPGGQYAVRQAQVKGKVEINSGGARFGALEAEGKVDIQQFGGMESLKALGELVIQGWGAPISGVVARSASYNVNNPDIRVVVDPKLSLKLTPVPLLQVSRPRIDAYDFRGEAHYRFERDEQDRIQVTVRQVNNIPDGSYRLGMAADSQQPNRLCRELDAAGRCLGGRPSYLICKGFDPDTGDCFAGSAPGKWKLAGTTMAPGVLWFDGDLEIGSGSYHNSFLATGNIVTSGRHISYAVNYAGKIGICGNPDFPQNAPLDYCRDGVFQSRPIGNAVLLAGGYQNNRFSGGDITLGASTQVYGNVWAGNMLFSGGSTTIHGYISAARQSGNASQRHDWGGSTTIDLSNLPDSFKPGADPGQNGGAGSGKRLRALPYSWMDSGAGS